MREFSVKNSEKAHAYKSCEKNSLNHTRYRSKTKELDIKLCPINLSGLEAVTNLSRTDKTRKSGGREISEREAIANFTSKRRAIKAGRTTSIYHALISHYALFCKAVEHNAVRQNRCAHFSPAERGLWTRNFSNAQMKSDA